jgi:hypothetical protein
MTCGAGTELLVKRAVSTHSCRFGSNVPVCLADGRKAHHEAGSGKAARKAYHELPTIRSHTCLPESDLLIVQLHGDLHGDPD